LINKTYSASLQTEDDIDIYAFTIEKPHAVTIMLEAENTGKPDSRHTISLADGVKYKLLERGEMTGDAVKYTLNTVYLAAGRYILQIESGKTWSNGAYRVSVHSEQKEHIEAEPNDSPSSATPLVLNTAITATTGVANDVDYYSFDLPEGGLTNIKMSYTPTKSTKDTYLLSVMNGDHIIWNGAAAGTAGSLTAPTLALPQGTYLIKIENPIWNNAEYQLIVNFKAAPVELENNNALSAATRLNVNQEIYGSLSNVSEAQIGSDIDNYKITLPQPGKVQISFSYAGRNDNNYYYILALADEETHALYSAGIKGNESEVTSPSVYLAAGDYYIQIRSDKHSWPGAYRLFVKYDEDALSEREFNGTMEDATDIVLNTQVSGSFVSKGDIDWFKFSLPADGVVRLSLSFNPLETSGKAYTMTLSDGKSPLQVTDFTGKESNKRVPPYVLPAGTYYVLLENPGNTMQDYALGAAYQPTARAEAEPNNKQADATALNLGVPLTGVLNTEKDIDYFFLSFDREMIVTLNFSFEQTSSENVYFILQLEQNGKTLLTENITGKSGGCEKKLQIPTGEYYLLVKPSAWSALVYTIGIK